jgi:hypothetical protein
MAVTSVTVRTKTGRGARRIAAVALVLAVGCATQRSAAPAVSVEPVTIDYGIDFLRAPARAEVRACFAPEAPAALQPSLRAAADLAAPVREGRCFRYEVDLERAADLLGDGRAIRHEAGAWTISPRVILWRPPKLTSDAVIRAKVSTPEGWRASTPWRSAGDALELGNSCFRRSGWIALGEIEERALEVPGGRMRVVLLNPASGPAWSVLEPWLARATGTVAAMTGRFPREETQVTVRPVAGRGVRFGLVTRNGSPSVLLLVGEDSEPADLEDDWVGVHEMTHLALPFVEMGNAWFYEGIATYYQEVLRARRGWFDERQAWQNLHDGFVRGRAEASGATLASASSRMMETGAFLHVYWAGTAITLLADVELRKRGRSLDAVLGELRGCCMQNELRFPIDAALAALNDDGVVRALASEHLGSAAFPALDALYEELGLRVGPDGTIVLDDKAPGAEIRRAIMRDARKGDEP